MRAQLAALLTFFPLLVLSGAAPALAQQATPGPETAKTAPAHLVLQWPKDKDTAVAAIGGKNLTLADLIAHVDERHFPGLRQALDEPERTEVHRFLQSDLIAGWVRHFTDLQVLKREAELRKLDLSKAEAACAASLKTSFEGWLQGYVDNLAEQGHPTEISQQRMNRLLADFQLRQGLACEVQGWLDFLEPDTYSKEQLNQFYKDYPRYFGGQVTFAHILIQHRDPGTGILFADERRAAALARLTEVRARIAAEGSNFAEIAKLFSEDSRTASRGGLIERAHRFDGGLPAALCRTAWLLRDGETSEAVESQYGFHIVHRIQVDQQVFFVFNDAALPTVREVMRRSRQEDLLFGARERHQIELKL